MMRTLTLTVVSQLNTRVDLLHKVNTFRIISIYASMGN